MKVYNYIIASVLIAFTFSYSAANAQATRHTLLTPQTMKWGDAPPGVPNGAKLAVLDGNPGGQGLYTVRLKLPKGYMLPAHWHPTDEFVTVISGAFKMGMGDKFDRNNLKTIPAGGFSVTPQKTNHFAAVDEETILQINGMGPFEITYVNPADDPRNKK
jgi:hypothetical protein